MNILHRHIFWSVLTTCAAAVGLFAFVLIIGNTLKDLLGLMLAGQVSVEVGVKLVVLLVPYVVGYALPMGVLTGVLLVLGRMSAQSEITAMRAAGLSLRYIARPVILLALAGVVLALFVNYTYMPRARAAYKSTLADAVRKNPLSFIVPRTFIRDFPGVVVYVGEKQGSLMKDFWVWQLDGEKRVKVFTRARSGRFDYNEEENKLVLTLNHVTVDTRDDADPEDFSEPRPAGSFEETSVDLKLDNLFGKRTTQIKLGWLTLTQLLARQRALEVPAPGTPEAAMTPAKRADALLSISVALHEKASSAFAVLAFAIIAVPLGIRVSRKETSANLGVALVLVMVYYFLTVVASWLDAYPHLHPDLLLWLPTALFLALGLWLFQRVDRA